MRVLLGLVLTVMVVTIDGRFGLCWFVESGAQVTCAFEDVNDVNLHYIENWRSDLDAVSLLHNVAKTSGCLTGLGVNSRIATVEKYASTTWRIHWKESVGTPTTTCTLSSIGVAPGVTEWKWFTIEVDETPAYGTKELRWYAHLAANGAMLTNGVQVSTLNVEVAVSSLPHLDLTTKPKREICSVTKQDTLLSTTGNTETVMFCSLSTNELGDHSGLRPLEMKNGKSAVIGASRAAQQRAGTAWVLKRHHTGWKFDQELQYTGSSDSYSKSGYGISVEMDGDRIAVAAHLEHTVQGVETGAITVYHDNGTMYERESERLCLAGQNTASYCYLGRGMVLRGNTLLATGGSDDIRTYLFSSTAQTFDDANPVDRVFSTLYSSFGIWGRRMQLSEDGLTLVVVSNMGSANSFPPIWVFFRVSTGSTEWVKTDVNWVPTTFPVNTNAVDLSGETLSVCFDNHNGMTFERNSVGEWDLAHDFGFICGSVSIENDILAMTEPSTRKVHVYKRETTTWTKTKELLGFGVHYSVTVSDNTIGITSLKNSQPDKGEDIFFFTALNTTYPCESWPEDIGLDYWTRIDCPSSGLSGTIPDSLKLATDLEYLDLSGNPALTGGIPDSLSSLVKLTRFDVKDCELGGSLPRIFSSMSELRHVDLRGNSLKGELPSNVFSGTKLGNLAASPVMKLLDGNCFNGTLAPLQSTFGVETWIPEVDFDAELQVTDAIPSCIPPAPTTPPTPSPPTPSPPEPVSPLEIVEIVGIVTGSILGVAGVMGLVFQSFKNARNTTSKNSNQQVVVAQVVEKKETV